METGSLATLLSVGLHSLPRTYYLVRWGTLPPAFLEACPMPSDCFLEPKPRKNSSLSKPAADGLESTLTVILAWEKGLPTPGTLGSSQPELYPLNSQSTSTW